MSIPHNFDPIGIKKVVFLDEYLRPRVDAAPLPYAVSLANSNAFVLEFDMEHFALGGCGIGIGANIGVDSFMVQPQEWSKSFVFRNNTQNVSITYNPQLVTGDTYAIKLDASGISIVNNGHTYTYAASGQPRSTESYDKMKMSPNSKYRRVKLSVGGEVVVDYRAAIVQGRKCLYDSINGTIIEI